MNSKLTDMMQNLVPATHTSSDARDADPKLTDTIRRFVESARYGSPLSTLLWTYQHLEEDAFLQKVSERLITSEALLIRGNAHIPYSGKLVIVSSGTLASVAGLNLVKTTISIRKDLVIVTDKNAECVLPLEQRRLGSTKKSGQAGPHLRADIATALDSGSAVLVFLGESKLRPRLKSNKQRPCAVFLEAAQQHFAPILPVALPSTGLLSDNQITIGQLIPWKAFSYLKPHPGSSYLFKKHIKTLRNSSAGLFPTVTTIAWPENRETLQIALSECQRLGETPDGKQILCYRSDQDSIVLREIGRLREQTFRTVGEGTGNAVDLDKFDYHYCHIIVWDPADREIAGAYRIGDLTEQPEPLSFYSSKLFAFNDSLKARLPEAMELGRSFVQPQYWGKRSLDYLWHGIGAYLKTNPKIRYLFGPVSISNDYPDDAKLMLVFFYWKYFGSHNKMATSPNPYVIKPVQRARMDEIFCSGDYTGDFAILKSNLKSMGCKVPTLYKQYSELCNPGGAQFMGFGIDPSFGDCVDGLVFVDLKELKDSKRKRYLDSK